METPTPKRTFDKFLEDMFIELNMYDDEWEPRGRLELTPVFELVVDDDSNPIPTPPPTPEKKIGQKRYYGRKRIKPLINADL